MSINPIYYSLIEGSYKCENCKHNFDGRAADFCDYCKPGEVPSKYRPARGTIQEKMWYDRANQITEAEFQRFMKKGK